MTHPKYGRIVRHRRLPVLLPIGARRGDDGQLLHIAAAEDDVFVHLIAARDLFGRVSFAAFGAVGGDAFERDRVVFRIDLMQRADVFDVGFGDEGDARADVFRHGCGSEEGV